MDTRKTELKGRTKKFAGRIVRLYVGLPLRRAEVAVLGRQMLRSGTSVAANYREASRARSADEFVAKIETCTQEADETQLWLELLRDDCAVREPELTALWSEADELIAIFVTMSKNTKQNKQRAKTQS
jgi:four helix bundle protein